MIWDVDGNSYLDFSSGVSVLNVGHCHPKVTKAITDQAKLFAHIAGTDFYHELQADLSERLCKLAPGGCDKKIFLSNSGHRIDRGRDEAGPVVDQKKAVHLIHQCDSMAAPWALFR